MARKSSLLAVIRAAQGRPAMGRPNAAERAALAALAAVPAPVPAAPAAPAAPARPYCRASGAEVRKLAAAGDPAAVVELTYRRPPRAPWISPWVFLTQGERELYLAAKAAKSSVASALWAEAIRRRGAARAATKAA